MTRYRTRRAEALERIQYLRQFDAPPLIVRAEQLALWSLRQWHALGEPDIDYSDLPGWHANYQKFISRPFNITPLTPR